MPTHSAHWCYHQELLIANQAENLSLQIAQIAKEYGNLLDFASKEKKNINLYII